MGLWTPRQPPQGRPLFFRRHASNYSTSILPTGGGGILICCFCLSHLTIDHASLSRRSTVPSPNRDTCNIWALITFCSYFTYVETLCLSYPLPVSPSVATICPGIATVFSLLSVTGSDLRASRFCYILYKSFFWVRHRKQAYYCLSFLFIALRFSDLAWFPESGGADELGRRGGP